MVDMRAPLIGVMLVLVSASEVGCSIEDLRGTAEPVVRPDPATSQPRPRSPIDTWEKLPAAISEVMGLEVEELVARYGKPAFVLTMPTGNLGYAYDPNPKSQHRDDGSICRDTFVVDPNGTVINYFCR